MKAEKARRFNADRIYNTDQTAHILGVPRSAVELAAGTGRLKSRGRGPRKSFVGAAIREWLNLDTPILPMTRSASVCRHSSTPHRDRWEASVSSKILSGMSVMNAKIAVDKEFSTLRRSMLAETV